MGQRTGRIDRQRLFKADNRLFVVIGEQPDKPPVKPDLRLRVRAGRARIGPQIKILGHEIPLFSPARHITAAQARKNGAPSVTQVTKGNFQNR